MTKKKKKKPLNFSNEEEKKTSNNGYLSYNLHVHPHITAAAATTDIQSFFAM